MREAGLIDLWVKTFKPNARKCMLEENAFKMKKQTDKRLGLENVMGAFVVLAVGILISFIIFVSEETVFYGFSRL